MSRNDSRKKKSPSPKPGKPHRKSKRSFDIEESKKTGGAGSRGAGKAAPFGRKATGAELSETRPQGAKAHSPKKFGKSPGRYSKKGSPKATPRSNNGEIRLNRFLANAGLASRREADDLISAGLVQINDVVVQEMGYKVKPTDTVKFNGSVVRREKKVYYVLNKPKGFISTVTDPKARKTVMDLMATAGPERIYPVGRLDRQTTGVLLFTNDGDLAKKLTHPSHGARKIYDVTLDKPLDKADFHKIQEGIELQDGPIKVDEISYIEGKDRKHVGLVLHSGRNRIVRRIFQHLGYEVTKLDRVIFAGITKKNLERGKWRRLSEQDVAFLHKG